MKFLHTKHQVARGARADAEDFDRFYLIKMVTELRATYQIRLLTFRAMREGKKLIIRLPKEAKIHPSLKVLRREHKSVLKIERT